MLAVAIEISIKIAEFLLHANILDACIIINAIF